MKKGGAMEYRPVEKINMSSNPKTAQSGQQKLSVVEFEKKLIHSLSQDLPYRRLHSPAEKEILEREIKKERRPAAVLMLFGYSSGIGDKEPHLLITRRSQQLPTHKGQMAFPGGLMEEADASTDSSPAEKNMVLAALREAQEEVGISRTKVRVLGVLPALPTLSSDFWVTPVVGILNPFIDEITLQESNEEIESAYWIPLSQLSQPEAYRQEWVEYHGSKIRTDVFQVGGDKIWGATGIMIRNLLDRLSASG